MDVEEKICRISLALRKRGLPGTDSQIARLLRVSPSTVQRWRKGNAEPRGRTAEAVDVLHRTVVQADEGNEDANKILVAFLGATGAALLGFGVGGALIAAGLGWILGEEERRNGGSKR